MSTFRISILNLIALLMLLASAAVALPSAKPSPSDLTRVTRTQGCANCETLDFVREPLTEGVAHYRWTLRVGPGELDRIGLHRVVRELAPYVPAPTPEAILLTHGARTGFAGTFLSPVGVAGSDASHNLPVYLAERDIDVWGVDLRWILVPTSTSDLSPLADWGMAQDAEDLGLALSVARTVRRWTGHGNRRIDLLGFSYGGRVGYAYLEAETSKPRRRRHVARYVALEGVFKTADPAVRAEACQRIDLLQASIDGGNYGSSSVPLSQVGRLALDAPEEPSAAIPGLTNRQAALFFVTGPGSAGLLPLHAFAGVFEAGFPVGLRFTHDNTGFNLLASASGFQPTAGTRDLMIVLCDEGSSTLDDRLHKVRTPVLYLGAAGGFADNGLDTFPFLGSSELESLVIAFEPPGQEAIDVGHGDIVMMDPADQLVWEPILDWITAP